MVSCFLEKGLISLWPYKAKEAKEAKKYKEAKGAKEVESNQKRGAYWRDGPRILAEAGQGYRNVAKANLYHGDSPSESFLFVWSMGIGPGWVPSVKFLEVF